jgi:hypothetical protein
MTHDEVRSMKNLSPIDGVPLQDRDLLQRLGFYFDTVDSRLRRGEGWVIFNASGTRSQRITWYLQSRISEVLPRWTYQFMPWRDLALTAYLTQVELQGIEELELTGRAREEFEIATRVSRQTMTRSVTADLLILSGLRPQHAHEVQYLVDTIERRYRDRLATIIITPEQPHELADDISRTAQFGAETWQHIESRLYETNLIAI